MAPRNWLTGFAAAALPVLLLAGCIEQPPDPSHAKVVFQGAFTTGVEPKAFSDSRLNALGIDTYQTRDGAASIRIDVPAESSGPPYYAGGIFESKAATDLSRTTALSFWARASRPAVVDKVGFGLNFAPYPTTHMVTVFDLPVTEEWTQHLIPIPDPARLDAERGLFWYADSDPVSYALWFADMQFVPVHPSLLDLRPAIGTPALTTAVGKKIPVPLTLGYADLDGTRREVDWGQPGAGPFATYFTFTSSDWGVATVDNGGVVTGVATGQARIGARLGQLELPQDLTVDVLAELPAAPTAGPPRPTVPAEDVKSLFSDAYPLAVTGIVYGTDWSNGGCPSGQFPNCGYRTDLNLGGDNVQRYTGLNFVGWDLRSRLDARGMTHFHVDVWTPGAFKFGVKLVSFPASGGSVEKQVNFNGLTTYGGTMPPISQGAWISLDIPLSMFPGLPLDSIGLIVWLDDLTVPPGGNEAGTFFMDNVYFHK